MVDLPTRAEEVRRVVMITIRGVVGFAVLVGSRRHLLTESSPAKLQKGGRRIAKGEDPEIRMQATPESNTLA